MPPQDIDKTTQAPDSELDLNRLETYAVELGKPEVLRFMADGFPYVIEYWKNIGKIPNGFDETDFLVEQLVLTYMFSTDQLWGVDITRNMPDALRRFMKPGLENVAGRLVAYAYPGTELDEEWDGLEVLADRVEFFLKTYVKQTTRASYAVSASTREDMYFAAILHPDMFKSPPGAIYGRIPDLWPETRRCLMIKYALDVVIDKNQGIMGSRDSGRMQYADAIEVVRQAKRMQELIWQRYSWLVLFGDGGSPTYALRDYFRTHPQDMFGSGQSSSQTVPPTRGVSTPTVDSGD